MWEKLDVSEQDTELSMDQAAATIPSGTLMLWLKANTDKEGMSLKSCTSAASRYSGFMAELYPADVYPCSAC